MAEIIGANEAMKRLLAGEEAERIDTNALYVIN